MKLNKGFKNSENQSQESGDVCTILKNQSVKSFIYLLLQASFSDKKYIMGGSPQEKKKKAAAPKDYISWFEIPAINFQQAVKFYNRIFNITMEENVTQANSMAFFPVTSGIGGSVVAGRGYVPSDSGPLIYLNGGKNLNNVLNLVADAGGRVVMQKTLISKEVGYFAVFIDSQGNKLALYSKN